jgi:apolipoprotein D and lipocalin family protein
MNKALFAAVGAAVLLASSGAHAIQMSGNTNVPQPAKSVSMERYLGRWYELARYEASFQKDCEGVTADYSLRNDGKLGVVNTCRQGSPQGTARSSTATARMVDGSNGTKLKVTFFPPIEGNYWILDHDPKYAWSIVGEPSGRYLWILSRTAKVSESQYDALVQKVKAMGYDTSRLRRTRH